MLERRIARHWRTTCAKLALSAAVMACSFIGLSPGIANADVTSTDYTVGSPASTSGVVVSPTTATSDVATGFEVSFPVTSALAGSNGSWISIVPSETLGSAPYNIDMVAATAGCIQAGTAGEAGPGIDSPSDLIIDIQSSCSIPAGATVEVDFTVFAPITIGNFDFSVGTSGSSAQVSNLVAVGTNGATLVAVSRSFGANTNYSISNVAVTNLSGSGNLLELTAGVTQGTEWITFYSGASGYSVTYTPVGGTPTVDPIVGSPLILGSGQAVELTLSTALVTGDVLDVTATGTNPIASSVTQANDISVTPGNGMPEPTNSITFGNAVSGVTVAPSSAAASTTTSYVVQFKAYSTVAAGGEIFISETSGPTNFTTVTGVLVTDSARPWQYVATTSILGDGYIDVPVLDTIEAGDVVALTFANVTNPPAGTVADFQLSTTADVLAVDAPPYSIGSSTTSGVVVAVSPITTSALATYAISNVVASGYIATGAPIGIQGPTGTVFPASPEDYTIADLTNPAGSGVVTTAVIGGGTDDVTISSPGTIAAGDHLSIAILDVVNPATASSTYTLTLVGALTGLVGASAFPHSDTAYPNGAIVSFSGTDYVFAGGHAFAVGSTTALAALQKVDHAAILAAPTGVNPPTAAPRAGTLVFTRPVNGSTTIYVVGTDGDLHGFATPAQFLGDGYDPALVVTVTSLSGLTVGKTAGSEGTAANALSTTADGAIIASSGAYYVLAGGRAFGVPNPASLAVIRKADKAKPLTGAVASNLKSATIANGVLLSHAGLVYVSFDGQLWPFGSLSQLAADGYGGTAAVTVPGSGGEAVVASYTGT
ncbi:MAG TPA: hypothetical protein VME46_10585 [Acidimicrobiales bacterium]|nr:hypothetical protein [Acidimicrobiales bacterium]